MSEFLMPSLGADMDEGTVLEWLVKPGDQVHRGDVIAVVDTTKAAVDVECFDSGAIGEILVPAGTQVPVGTPLATIISPTEPREPAASPVDRAKAPGPPTEPPGPPTGPPPATPAEPPPATPTPPAAPLKAPVQPVQATPPVRSLAGHLGVDLTAVHGTGHDGRITRADVEQAAATPRRRISPYARRLAGELGVDLSTVRGDPVHAADVRAATTPAPRQRGDSLRQATAALMSRSKREIPHYYLGTTIDLRAAADWLDLTNRSAAVADRLVPAALLLKATAVAAARVPSLNGHWVDDAFRPADEVRLGVAVSLRGGGLMVPVLPDAAELGLRDLMRLLRDLVSRARTGRLRASELTGATTTVTNLGELGVESVHGVIHPPQVALTGFGAITDRPWAVDGQVGIRPVVTATLSADHRASDGATGARFLNTIDTLLQHPEEL